MTTMCQLLWEFDWANAQATAKAAHGIYHIARTAPGQWMAGFTRTGPPPVRTQSIAAEAGPLIFPTMADAVRACHSHAERYATH